MNYDEKLNMSLLFDFYGDILTERQKEIASLSFDEDLSLREISEITGITPQGVRDSLNKSKVILTEMEEKLGLEHNSVGLMPLIETAMGVENAFAIATAAKRVRALFLGAEELTADLQCKRTKEGKEIFYARTRLVMAARAAGVEVYDTPFTDVHDDEGIQVDAAFAKSLGFSGKASISPRHVEVINTVFTPTMEEIDYAYAVIDALELAKQQGKGAISLRGKMIDAPIVARAERTIAVAEALGIRREEG
jgi:citrate lyase subunit beta/citryl-CoA lyase